MSDFSFLFHYLMIRWDATFFGITSVSILFEKKDARVIWVNTVKIKCW